MLMLGISNIHINKKIMEAMKRWLKKMMDYVVSRYSSSSGEPADNTLLPKKIRFSKEDIVIDI